MRDDTSILQRYLLRPALVIWALLATGMMAAVVIDAFSMPDSSPFQRLLKHRDNLASPEWQAAIAVADQVERYPLVVVDDEPGLFLLILRYRLCPSWVWPLEHPLPADPSWPDSAIAFVTFEGDSARVQAREEQ